MFAGDGAAQANGFIEDFFEGFLDAMHFLLVPFVSEEGRVQVAVAHVTEGADLELELAGDRGDKADHVRQFAARDGGIFENGGRRYAREGGKGTAASAGQLVGFG